MGKRWSERVSFGMERSDGRTVAMAWLSSFAWRTALSHPPSENERAILDRTLQRPLATYTQEKDAAKKLASVGDLPKAPGLDDTQLAAWTAVANVLLNLNETISN